MTAPPVIPKKVQATFRIRGATAAEWAAENPVLLRNEPGYDHTFNSIKIGDGITPWNKLRYVGQDSTPIPTTGNAGLDAVILEHVRSVAPHPVYDEGPSFLLLYQNAKV